MASGTKTASYRILHQYEVPYGYPNAGLYRQLEFLTHGCNCPDCGLRTHCVHEQVPKVVVSGTYNGTPIYDSFLHRRFKCKNCHRTFMDRVCWLFPFQRLTEPGKVALLYAAADGTFQTVGEDFGRSGQNVKVHVRRYYDQVIGHGHQTGTTPAFLGIDEISLAKGKGSYRLVVYDLTVPWRPQLFRMHDSRKKDEVIALLRQFASPERIIGIAIDMWEPYKLAIETALPHVHIVIDAFHLIQASTKALDDVRKSVQTKLNKEQALAMKQEKELFAKPIEELTEEERIRLKAWETAIPELAKAISLHQKLRGLYRSQDFDDGLALLADWEKEVLDADLAPFHRLLKTVWNWLPEIMNRFICKISNARTEGKNNQLRAMNKQGFGYSLSSLKARMEIKEQQTALNRWRQYQDHLQHKSS
jgi:transposase